MYTYVCICVSFDKAFKIKNNVKSLWKYIQYNKILRIPLMNIYFPFTNTVWVDFSVLGLLTYYSFIKPHSQKRKKESHTVFHIHFIEKMQQRQICTYQHNYTLHLWFQHIKLVAFSQTLSRPLSSVFKKAHLLVTLWMNWWQ